MDELERTAIGEYIGLVMDIRTIDPKAADFFCSDAFLDSQYFCVSGEVSSCILWRKAVQIPGCPFEDESGFMYLDINVWQLRTKRGDEGYR